MLKADDWVSRRLTSFGRDWAHQQHPREHFPKNVPCDHDHHHHLNPNHQFSSLPIDKQICFQLFDFLGTDELSVLCAYFFRKHDCMISGEVEQGNIEMCCTARHLNITLHFSEASLHDLRNGSKVRHICISFKNAKKQVFSIKI